MSSAAELARATVVLFTGVACVCMLPSGALSAEREAEVTLYAGFGAIGKDVVADQYYGDPSESPLFLAGQLNVRFQNGWSGWVEYVGSEWSIIDYGGPGIKGIGSITVFSVGAGYSLFERVVEVRVGFAVNDIRTDTDWTERSDPRSWPPPR